MTFMLRRLRVSALLLFLLLVIALACVGTLRAQLKKDDVDFEVLATVTAEKGYNCCLWNMAEKHLGDPLQWKCIKEMNKIPNERNISIGTVVYVPAKCKKGYVEKEKPAVVEPAATDWQKKLDDCMAELEKCEKELAGCRERAKGSISEEAYNECKAERNKLKKQLAQCKKAGGNKKKMRELQGDLESCEDRIHRLERAMKDKDATIEELEAKLQRMRHEAEECDGLRQEVRRREERIHELERELEKCRDRLEDMEGDDDDDDNGRMKEERHSKAPMPKKGECKTSRSFVAAMAIALVGAAVWIGTSASD